MAGQSLSLFSELRREITNFRLWLHDRALPLWVDVGVDRINGGFVERVGQDGVALGSDLRRARVQPRQIYCFVAAGLNGWAGAWRETSRNGASWFNDVYMTSSGLYGNVASYTGELVDCSIDIYNQAFALFAYAHVHKALPEFRAETRRSALALLNVLNSRYKHSVLGFEAKLSVNGPLFSNPHMHLFEAILAWEEEDPNGPWSSIADELAELTKTYLVDTATGTIRECYDDAWMIHPTELGNVIEPGHQFEWAWLLVRWGLIRSNPEAITIAKHLFANAERHGVCAKRNIVVLSLRNDFSVRDGDGRLWSQTEWLKAAVRLASISEGEERDRYLASAYRAICAMKHFTATPIDGLWFDRWLESGELVDEPAPASTFYHLVCAIYEADITCCFDI